MVRYASRGGREVLCLHIQEFKNCQARPLALNGGPQFKFNESISFSVDCKTQSEVDEFWEKLFAGGEEGPCGWLKDKYGLSWQVTPTILGEMLSDPDPEKSKRVMDAMLTSSLSGNRRVPFFIV